MLKRVFISFLFLMSFLYFYNFPSFGQEPNTIANIYRDSFDSTIVFKSPRPLLTNNINNLSKPKFWGLNIILSNSGFGFGGFYEMYLSKNTSMFVNLYLSGARNTDEFEYYDPFTGEIFIPGKVNRLYMFPLTFGISQSFLTEVLGTNFTPFFNLGLGPTFIVSTPYEKEFFTSIGYARMYIRFGGFIGAGINIPITDKSYFGVSARHYWIPFGGKGLESIKDKPIKDFGGFFLGLNIGIKI
ncbi:MAG: hypothetical protein ACPLPX_08035 [Candidatus Kapaibacteriota bacterium]